MLALNAEQRDRVMVALLIEEEAGEDWGIQEKDVLEAIRGRRERRKKDCERAKRYQRIKRESAREPSREFDSEFSCEIPREIPREIHAEDTPSPSPVPPLCPPSSLPPVPPIPTPPYNPPSPTPSSSFFRASAKTAAAEAKDADFEKFWSEYPRKIGKKPARRAFDKVKVPVETLVDALRVQKCGSQWAQKQFIPHPATWLNQERWEDEVETDSQSNGLSWAELAAQLDGGGFP